MSESLGKVLLGVVSGTKERKIGRTAATSSLGGAAVPRSYSSHMKVRASPSASVAEPVRVNGVCLGMVKAAPAFTTGALLPVAVETAQLLPVLPVEKVTI